MDSSVLARLRSVNPRIALVATAGMAVVALGAVLSQGPDNSTRLEATEAMALSSQSVTLPGRPDVSGPADQNGNGASTNADGQAGDSAVLVVDIDADGQPSGPTVDSSDAEVGDQLSEAQDPDSQDNGDSAETNNDSTGDDATPSTADDGAATSTSPTTKAPATTTTAPPTTAAPTTAVPTTAAPTTAKPAAAAPGSGSTGTVTGSAPGTGRRVIYVDKNGGNYNNPGTIDRPMGRPIDALSRAQPGDTILIRGGVYDTNSDGAFNIRRSGTADAWIRIAPYPGEEVELRAGGQYGGGFEILGASYIEVSGFTIRGRNDSEHGAGVLIKDRAHNIRVVGNTISNFGGGGISVVESSLVTIEGNDVRDNAHRSSYQGSGISVFEAAGPTVDGYSFIIRGNYVARNYNTVPSHKDGRITDGNCIILDRNNEVGYTGRTLIENNVCVENGGRGIHFYRSSNILARNNTLYHNMWSLDVYAGRGEMTVGYGRNVQFVNNLVINRDGVNSFVSNSNENTSFVNNWVASSPPPGDSNRVLNNANVFSSTNWNGSVDQFRPVASAGLSGSANDNRPSIDYFGQQRSNPGAIGAIEP